MSDYWKDFIPAMRTTRLGDCTDSDPELAAAWLGWQMREGCKDPVTVEPENGYRIRLDGDAWRATGEGFTNLQESQAGFGDTPMEALKQLVDAAEHQSKT